ncbi:MAG: RNA polymerase sigma factor [Bacteroidia bacterium]
MFNKKYNPEDDLQLIQESIAGNKASLEKLIKIHQDYIYNISLKLFLDPDDALDATQEVLIKVITSLKTFKGESQFRTWLYRIAFNHFLNTPKRKIELLLESEPSHYAGFSSENEQDAINEEEIEEVRILCSTAMLMCLNREQRLLYIIGEIFGADHHLGADLFNLTPANYRVRLHRTKSDLFNFVSGKCGIINPENPCRCPKKTRFLVDKGIVDKTNFKFNADYTKQINEIVTTQKNEISDTIQLELKGLFMQSPFQVKKELDNLVNEIVK